MAEQELEHFSRREPRPEPEPADGTKAKKKAPPSPSSIIVTQVNPSSMTVPNEANNPVVKPPVLTSPPASFRFLQSTTSEWIHEFLFKIQKGGKVFWMGAAVPMGTTDFTRAQIFFHPTVKQGHEIRAAEEDYHDFKGGWSTGTSPLQRYVAMQGGQLAEARRLMPLLVPFMTMAAVNKGGSDNMFSDRPVDTLNTVIAAIQSEVTGTTGAHPKLSKLGSSSFSSGIHALRMFVGSLGSSGLIKEIIDFDSPHIVSERTKRLLRLRGATTRCFTQIPKAEIGSVTLTNAHFERVTAHNHHTDLKTRLHAQIGFLMYMQAMQHSVIR